MANELQTEEGKVYGLLSAFYLALWAHLDAFSDENRWLRASKALLPKERAHDLMLRFETLQSMKMDRILRSSIFNEYNRTMRLAEEFLERGEYDVALSQQVKEWKGTLQKFGLEYARLESES